MKTIKPKVVILFCLLVSAKTFSQTTIINRTSNASIAPASLIFGVGAGASITTNSTHRDAYNVFLGYSVGNIASATLDGENLANTAVAAHSGVYLRRGSFNSYFGYASGYSNQVGFSNTLIGAFSGQNLIAADNNTFVGMASGNTSRASENTYIGFYAGSTDTTAINTNTGEQNTAVGAFAGTGIKSGGINTLMGYNAGKSINSANNNTFVGGLSGSNTTAGGNNTFLGVFAGSNNRTGHDNMMLGFNAGYDGVGTVAKNSNYNVFIGNSAGAQTTNDFNTFIGYAAGSNNVSGNSNIYIGGYAGGHSAATNNNTCTFIGSQSGPWTGTNHAAPTAVFNNLTNATAIGNRAKCTISNALVLGGVDDDAVKVGIGMTNPAYPLDVKGVVNMRISYNSPSIKINDRNFLELDEQGEYVLNTFKMKYENANQWSDKVFEKTYNLLTINELQSFIQQNKHLPNIPSANEVVKNGVKQDELNAKLLEKIEELSLYIIQLEKRISKIEHK
jgi:trimeric autotransporter adhesin